jgi:hypothetical protein
VKGRNLNGESPPIANDGTGTSRSEPQAATHKQSRTPPKAVGTPPPALAREEDRQLDHSLRPRSLVEFVGQERIKSARDAD